MPLNYAQTDTGTGLSNNNNPWCASGSGVGGPLTGGNVPVDTLATVGGTSGSTQQTRTVAAGTGTVGSTRCVYFVCKLSVNSGVVWNSGTWTWRINITTANMNLTITDVFICRVNSSNVSQATIGSTSGLSTSIGSTGVISGTISGSSQTPGVGDYVVLIIAFTNSSMSTQNFGVTPNQNIDTPFDISAIPNKIVQIKQAVKRSNTY